MGSVEVDQQIDVALGGGRVPRQGAEDPELLHAVPSGNSLDSLSVRPQNLLDAEPPAAGGDSNPGLIPVRGLAARTDPHHASPRRPRVPTAVAVEHGDFDLAHEELKDQRAKNLPIRKHDSGPRS